MVTGMLKEVVRAFPTPCRLARWQNDLVPKSTKQGTAEDDQHQSTKRKSPSKPHRFGWHSRTQARRRLKQGGKRRASKNHCDTPEAGSESEEFGRMDGSSTDTLGIAKAAIGEGHRAYRHGWPT
jgi:hypothetical protein